MKGEFQFVGVALFASSLCCLAIDQPSFVLDSAGGMSSNATFNNNASLGHGIPAGSCGNSQLQNYSGFFNTFLLNPTSDADGDGIADENDSDDDNDGITDFTELAGNAFSPVTETDPFSDDSDDDGVSDGEEAGAGTNPLDADNLLAISRVEHTPDGDVIEWQSRGGRHYLVDFSRTVESLSSDTNLLGAVTSLAGTGVWQQTMSSFTNPATNGKGFYRVRTTP